MLSLHIEGAETVEITELYQQISELIHEENVSIIPSYSFNGVNEVVLIIGALGGGTATVQLAKVIISWINQKKGRKVKVKGIEINNYSADDVVKILKAVGDE